jgi:quinol monooxygenase YgiN
MVRVFVRHRVRDYAIWRQHYDAALPLRRESGALASSVHRTVGKPDEVTICSDFASAEQAKAFLGRAELRDAMANAGVAEAPAIWIADIV